jgi:hypothetical protein
VPARSIVDRLLDSNEPSIRWKVRTCVVGDDPQARAIRRLRDEIRKSTPVRRLLAGHSALRPGVYAKWQGGHWVLLALADLGYPAGDATLAPIRDDVLRTWLAERYFRELAAETRSGRAPAVPVINGRHRRCASQQGGALLSVVRLGLEDDRASQLVERLLHWQWPDGGWNCDPDPDARSSSVYETLLPMRALTAYAHAHGDTAARDAANRAAEVLLERRLLYRRSTRRLVRAEWAKLHYPVYWHYDVLAALKGLAELGRIADDRCRDALDLLESKQLAAGGWPSEAKYYRGAGERRTGFDHVDWGGADSRRMNKWVTADALGVLAAAGRLFPKIS